MLMKVISHLSLLAPWIGSSILGAYRSAPASPRHLRGAEARHAPSIGQRPIRILLVDDSDADLEPYVHELKRAQFEVCSRVARNAPELTELFLEQPYDVVVCDDTMREWSSVEALTLLRQRDPEIPIIILTGTVEMTDTAQGDIVTEFILRGATDCVDKKRPSLLPLAAAFAVEERVLNEERNRVEQELERSRALYCALSESPTYGVCRFDAAGRLRDVNQALVTMLGYVSRDELWTVSQLTDLMHEVEERAPLLESGHLTDRVDGLEVEWTRTDGKPITLRLDGRQVGDEMGGFDGWELVIEDVTEQRALEDHLRQMATTDAVTRWQRDSRRSYPCGLASGCVLAHARWSPYNPLHSDDPCTES